LTTLQAYARHAEQFGTDCVFPTALVDAQAGYGLSPRELVELKLELRRVAGEHKRTKKPPTWTDDVPRLEDSDVLALNQDGFTASEIVAHTGFTLARVEAVLSTIPEPIEYDRTRSSTDVSGWDAEILSGGGLDFSELAEEPHGSAEKEGDFIAKDQKTGDTPFWLKAQAPEAKAKAAETKARRQAQKEKDVLVLRERGMVPLAIATKLKMDPVRVKKIIRASA